MLAGSLVLSAAASECCADGLTLTAFPRDLVSLADTVTISWAESIPATFYYSPMPGGGLPENYPLTISATICNRPGLIQFVPDGQMPAGIYYCLVSESRCSSAEFILAIESDQAPQMISPRTSQGQDGIHTTSPTFRWQGVSGIPYYHILLSDQPFEIAENEFGELCVTGANIIWQAITAETSIPYGTPDPSGTLPEFQPPPLVQGPRYNWLVLNNYGNHPSLTSAVTAGPAGFEVSVDSPFPAPLPIEPESGSVIFSDQITFRWSEVSNAVCYHFYLYEVQREGGNSISLPISHTVTTRTVHQVTACSLLRNGDYTWKILAADACGYGSLSQESCFSYTIESATLAVKTMDDNGTPLHPADDTPLPIVHVEIENIQGYTGLWNLVTDENGYRDCQLPLGTYLLEGHRTGYELVTETLELERDGQVVPITFTLQRSPSSVRGTTIDQEDTPLAQVSVMAVDVSGGQQRGTQTDLNGTFLLNLRQGTWIVYVEKPDCASPRGRTITVGAGENLNLNRPELGGPFVLIKNQYLLSGTITNPEGQAIWQAEVIAGNGIKELRDQTDALGQYAFSIEPDVWELTAEKVGYASPQPEAVTITDADAIKNLVMIPRASLVSGRVIDGVVGLSGVILRAIPLAGSVISSETDGTGSFTLSLLPGTYRLQVESPEYVQLRPLYLTLGLGETFSGLEIPTLLADASISGRVTADGASGLGDVLVTDGRTSAITTPDGSYRLAVLSGSHDITVSKSEYICAKITGLPVSPGQNLSVIDLTLTGNAGILDGFVFSNGQPVCQAAVFAESQESAAETTFTGQDGKYSFSVMPESYVISVHKAGLLSDLSSMTAVARAGQRSFMENFYMRENLARICGVVSDGSHPLKQTIIQLDGILSPRLSYGTITDPDGRFILMVAGGEGYAITGSRDGYICGSDTVSSAPAGTTREIYLALEPCDGKVKGRVVLPGDYPVQAALVKAYNGSRIFETYSAGDGSFQLPLKAGTYTIEVLKPGCSGQASVVNVPLGATIEGLCLLLEDNLATLTGTVRDAASAAPLTGTLLTAEEISSGRGGSAHTDNLGCFSIGNLTAGLYQIAVRHTGYTSQNLSGKILVGGELTTVDFRLHPLSADIQGHVYAETLAVSGASVTIITPSEIVAQTSSDANGAFALSGLPEGICLVQAFKKGYTSTSADTVCLAAGETQSSVLYLRTNRGVIAGRVIENSLAVGGVVATAAGDAGNFAADTTGSDGRYRLSKLAPDTYIVRISAAERTSSPAETTVVVADDDSVAVDFLLIPNSRTISGQVTDQQGFPLKNVDVKAGGGSLERVAESNDSGHYIISGLSAHCLYTVETNLYQQGYQNASRSAQVLDADLTDVDLVVQVAQGIIEGNVGLEGVTITVVGQSNGVQMTGFSQPDGSYQVRYLRAGDYLVSVQKLGCSALPAQREVLNLEYHEQRSGVNFTMSQNSLIIQGRVVDQDGDPVMDAPVAAWCSDLTSSDTTDSQGRYCICGLFPEQTYQLGTKLPFYLYENGQIAIQIDRENVSAADLPVGAHTAAIQGQILDHLGQPLQNAAVKLCPGGQMTTVDAGGGYQFDGLWAGSYEVAASAVGRAGPAQQVSLLKGQIIQADFQLQPVPQAIYGNVRDGDEFLAGAVVTLSAGGKWAAADTADFSGNYAFETLNTALVYDLAAHKRGYEPDRILGLSVTEGQSRRLDLYPGAILNAIRGTVFDHDGDEPVSGVLVRAVGLNGVLRTDTTDDVGDYCLSDLSSGTYTVVALYGSETGQAHVLSIHGGQARRADFLLDGAGSICGNVTYGEMGRPGALITAVNQQTGVPYSDISGGEGHFSILGLPRGEYTVTVSICGFQTPAGPSMLSVYLGTATALQVDLVPGVFSLVGSVRDVLDLPICAAMVKATVAGHQDSVLSDVMGNYALNLPSSPECVVQARVQGFHSAPAETASVQRGDPAVVDFQLTPQANSIFGTVKDGNTAEPLADVHVTLEDSLGNVSQNITSLSGEFLFSAQPGRYLLGAQKDGYNTCSHREIVLLSGSFINQDVMLNPQVTFVPLAGAVTWGPEPVSQILVTAWSLSRGTRDSTWTAEDGCYRFEQLLAPDNYLVEASGDGFSPISTGPIFLTTPGAEWNLKFPRGQICWLITGENEILLPGVQIRLSGTGVDTCLYTDPSGTCQTSAHLREGTFLVSISPDADRLPVVPYSLQLESDQNYLDPVNLAVRHTPWPADSSFSVGEDVPICARVYSAEESTQVHLYYRGPNDLDFIGVEMMPQGKRSSLMEKQRTAIRTESQTNGSDVLYRAAIPGQPVSGILEYFIEARHKDHIFTRRCDPYQMIIYNRGVLYRAGISPEEKQLQTEMPYIFLVQTYDDQGNNLSDQLIGEDVVWTVLEGPGEIQKSMEDPTQATYVSHEDGAARIGATVIQGEITVSAQARVTTQAAVLGHLEILGPVQPDISNRSQASLRCVAQDTSGREVCVWPQWDFQPQGAGTMARSLNGDKITFVPSPNFIGQVRIFLADSFSGRTAEYNAEDGVAEWNRGLGIYHLLIGGSPGNSLQDEAGFQLVIPDSILTPGQVTQISLHKPAIPDVKRYTPRHQIHGEIYDLRSSSTVSFLLPLEMNLPIVPDARSLSAVIGRWDPTRLIWAELAGTRLGDEISTLVDHFSQFAVLGLSEPLAINDIRLLPNPFTPYDPYGLQLAFTLSTDRARKPFVTIKIYNMTGELVRTICENEPLPKGTYLPGEDFMDSRGHDITRWDGRTDNGDMARNGRYLVHFRAEDSAGTVEALKTVVLIK